MNGRKIQQAALIAMIMCLVVFGFEGWTAAEERASQFKWPTELIASVSEVGGSEHGAWSALAPILEQSAGMKVRVIPESVFTVRMVSTLKGRAIGVTASHHQITRYYEGVSGAELSAEKLPSRVFWAMFDTFSVYYTTADSPVKGIYDLKQTKGMKIGTCTGNPSIEDRMRTALPAFLGMTHEDAEKHFTYVPFGNPNMFFNGPTDDKSDVAYIITSSSTGFQIASHPKGIRILDLPRSDKEAWKRYTAATLGGDLPGKVDYGFKQSIGKEGFRQYKVMVTSPATDQELIYQLTKWLYDPQNYDRYKGLTSSLERTKTDLLLEFIKASALPIADGTIRYLKEIGKWSADDDKRNKKNIEIMDKWVKGWQTASTAAKDKGIKIDYKNEAWIKLWRDTTATTPHFEWGL